MFRAVSFKVSLSSALIATVALLIIVVVVAVVVGVFVIVAVVVVGVVVIFTVVVAGVVVIVGICRSASTVPGQMANPFAIITPRWARTFMMKYPQTFVLNSIMDPLVHQFSSKFNCLMHCFWPGCLHAIINHVSNSVVVAVGAGVTGGTCVDLVVLFGAIFLKSQENNIPEISYNQGYG
nr:hypothetical protein [Tanacetum cinerariifolium]